MKKTIKKQILVFIILLLSIIPFYLCILQSLPSADDFGMRNASVGISAVINAVHRANGYYMEWGGTWPTWFVTVLLNPLNYVGYHVEVIGVELVCFFTLWLLSLIYFLYVISKMLFKINSQVVNTILMVSVLIFMLNQRIYTQVFYWYCGCPYLWWMSTTFLLWAVTIKYFLYEKNKGKIVVLSIIGFITCFAQYYIIPVGGFYFCFLCMEYRNKKIRKHDIVPLLFMMLGGILTVISPGNYIRHEVIDSSGIHPIMTVWMTVKYVILQEVEMIFTKYFLVGILIIFFIGFGARGYVEKIINPIWILILGSLIMSGAVYPVILGYSSIELPNRVMFIFDMFNALMISLSAFMFGCKMRNIADDKNKDKVIKIGIASIILIFCLGLIFTDAYKEIPSIKQCLKYADVCQQHQDWLSVLDEILNSDEDNVVVYRESMTDSGITKSVELTADPNVWRNVRIAEYYGKQSVSLKIGK